MEQIRVGSRSLHKTQLLMFLEPWRKCWDKFPFLQGWGSLLAEFVCFCQIARNKTKVIGTEMLVFTTVIKVRITSLFVEYFILRWWECVWNSVSYEAKLTSLTKWFLMRGYLAWGFSRLFRHHRDEDFKSTSLKVVSKPNWTNSEINAVDQA